MAHFESSTRAMTCCSCPVMHSVSFPAGPKSERIGSKVEYRAILLYIDPADDPRKKTSVRHQLYFTASERGGFVLTLFSGAGGDERRGCGGLCLGPPLGRGPN